MTSSLRLRLTIWYLGLFSLLFILFSVFLHSRLAKALEGRVDERLIAEADTAASLFLAELEELKGDVPTAAEEAIEEMRPRGVLLAFVRSQGLLAASGPAPPGQLEAAAALAWRTAQADSIAPMPQFGKHGARAALHRFTVGNSGYLAVAVASTDSIAADLARFRGLLYISLPALLALVGLGGFAVATRGLAPLDWMAAQAREITSSSLERRLEVGAAAEELMGLAASFNELLSRLDRSFETMRRFVADASHEMRTPLAVIRGEADVALVKDRSPAEYLASLAVIQDESRRMSRLVEDLLNLARADAGHVRLRIEELYLDDLLGECCRTIKPLANARQVSVECISAEDVRYRGDAELLRRMVLNLLDNAVRYTPAGGRISAGAETVDSGVRIRVADTGIGIAEDAAPHIFERFYRADKARSREEGGFGLGLSIVKWIAEAHQGSVEMNTHPGAGSTFSVFFPR